MTKNEGFSKEVLEEALGALRQMLPAGEIIRELRTTSFFVGIGKESLVPGKDGLVPLVIGEIPVPDDLIGMMKDRKAFIFVK